MQYIMTNSIEFKDFIKRVTHYSIVTTVCIIINIVCCIGSVEIKIKIYIYTV